MKRICLIEHRPEASQQLRELLTQAGYAVSAFLKSSDGFVHMLPEPPDLAIVEMFLPDNDGVEMLLSIRGPFPDLPVLMIAAAPHALAFSSLAMALRLGADAALQAPFSTDELLATVGRLVGRNSLNAVLA